MEQHILLEVISGPVVQNTNLKTSWPFLQRAHISPAMQNLNYFIYQAEIKNKNDHKHLAHLNDLVLISEFLQIKGLNPNPINTVWSRGTVRTRRWTMKNRWSERPPSEHWASDRHTITITLTSCCGRAVPGQFSSCFNRPEKWSRLTLSCVCFCAAAEWTWSSPVSEEGDERELRVVCVGEHVLDEEVWLKAVLQENHS